MRRPRPGPDTGLVSQCSLLGRKMFGVPVMRPLLSHLSRGTRLKASAAAAEGSEVTQTFVSSVQSSSLRLAPTITIVAPVVVPRLSSLVVGVTLVCLYP